MNSGAKMHNDVLTKNSNDLNNLYSTNKIYNIEDKVNFLSKKLNIWKFNEDFHKEEDIKDIEKLKILEKIYLNKARDN